MNMHQMEWFCCAYELKSFAKASAQAFISRQAFGKAMRALEDELGAPLFARDCAGVWPTPFAEALYPHIAACIVDYRAMLTARDSWLSQAPMIRVAIAEGVARVLPETLFARMQASDRGIEYRIEKHSAARCLELLAEGGVDFAFATSSQGDARFKRLAIVREKLYVACHRSLVRCSDGAFHPEEFEGVTFFLLGEQFAGDIALIDAFRNHGIELLENRQFQDYDIILREVGRARGAAIVPEGRIGELDGRSVVLAALPARITWDVELCWRDEELVWPHQDFIALVQSLLRGRRER